MAVSSIVGGLLGGKLILAGYNLNMTSSMNDIDVGGATWVWVTANGGYNITGFAGGVEGRVLVIGNISTQAITLTRDDTNSAAANRIRNGTGGSLVLPGYPGAGVILVYSEQAASAVGRWIGVGRSN